MIRDPALFVMMIVGLFYHDKPLVDEEDSIPLLDLADSLKPSVLVLIHEQLNFLDFVHVEPKFLCGHLLTVSRLMLVSQVISLMNTLGFQSIRYLMVLRVLNVSTVCFLFLFLDGHLHVQANRIT